MHQALGRREKTRLTDEDEKVDRKTKGCEGDVGFLYSWFNWIHFIVEIELIPCLACARSPLILSCSCFTLLIRS